MAENAPTTPYTVLAHMLYENSNPFQLYEPGDHLDVTDATYSALDKRRNPVAGSKWFPIDTYTVKFEGTCLNGYQSVSLALIRKKKLYTKNIQAWVVDVETSCKAKV